MNPKRNLSVYFRCTDSFPRGPQQRSGPSVNRSSAHMTIVYAFGLSSPRITGRPIFRFGYHSFLFFKCLVGQALLCTFMPLEDAAAQQTLLKRIIDMWPWIGSLPTLLLLPYPLLSVSARPMRLVGQWLAGAGVAHGTQEQRHARVGAPHSLLLYRPPAPAGHVSLAHCYFLRISICQVNTLHALNRISLSRLSISCFYSYSILFF